MNINRLIVVGYFTLLGVLLFSLVYGCEVDVEHQKVVVAKAIGVLIAVILIVVFVIYCEKLERLNKEDRTD